MEYIYENTINGYGALASTFLEEGIVIFFGENAPATLKDYCYTIDIKKARDVIEVGQTIEIGTNHYKITAVGEVAQKNLESLGHLTIAFTGENESVLPGTIVVEKNQIPEIGNGTQIKIFNQGVEHE
ncbi:MAG: PTS glucitol/sorbitol transporter subunit IIA [Erysipelotrichaceae bacterium]|nr:PTS glucitol/sorbitol transporter subunit IIA [Erysipelotrichaceae bacterium]